jgi:hypothetical protein
MKPAAPKPTGDTLPEWSAHWPFKRACPELIRRANSFEAQRKKQPPQGEPAPF